MVTRSCVDHRFLLRPGVVTNQIVGYLLALAATRYEVEVHAYCVMSNHMHLVVTDPHARLPEFFGYLDAFIGRAVNQLYGRTGCFWDDKGYNAVLAASPEDVLDRCVYVLANPVKAGLVRKARQWPGLWSPPDQVGETVTFDRPSHFFRTTGTMPGSASLRVTVPPGCGEVEDFRRRLAAALAVREAEEGRKRLGVLGVARVLKQRVWERPARPKERPTLKPRFAARDLGRRIELARRLKLFLAEHRESLLAWRDGRRDTVFPEGTYLMRVLHGAACAGAG